MKALLLDRSDDGVTASVRRLDPADLPNQGSILLTVDRSSLNYKDALAVTGSAPIVRAPYPFVPGIDLAGQVVRGSGNDIEPGDLVIVTGWGVGEVHWGGYSQMQVVRPEWTVKAPPGLSASDAMALGTAGLTAMLSLMTLERCGLSPASGEVVVTGATGGVGSLAVFFLSRAGFDVVASTGSESARDYLTRLGAKRVIDRELLAAGAVKALDSGRWAGAVDVVGGTTLASILSQVDRHGAVAACGLAASADLVTTLYPFILRGVSLVGIDSNTCPAERRRTAWLRMAELVDTSLLGEISREIALEDVPEESRRLLEGSGRGRVVVDLTR